MLLRHSGERRGFLSRRASYSKRTTAGKERKQGSEASVEGYKPLHKKPATRRQQTARVSLSVYTAAARLGQELREVGPQPLRSVNSRLGVPSPP